MWANHRGEQVGVPPQRALKNENHYVYYTYILRFVSLVLVTISSKLNKNYTNDFGIILKINTFDDVVCLDHDKFIILHQTLEPKTSI